ncbi:MAG: glutamate--tRNA ligase [Ruminococcaceae bacterium]|nr:glutamate--tRNA ligase [Oscillospiraceae bacterium]
MKNVRTRFAPSPTGYMHVGNLRTALYAYLVAKKNNGTFVLRIEDTDKSRQVEGALDVIYSTLKDSGLNWDEGPDIGGNYGPYIQSERKDNYLEYAEKLVKDGKAYYCFCKKEDIENRISVKSDYSQGYDGFCSGLSEETVSEYLKEGKEYVIRQKMPKTGKTVFNDLVYGTIEVSNEELEDQILIKSDKMPTYNFANVIDDHLMGISHVIRGNEYLSSTPKYTLLYDAFGWESPEYIHCPQVMRDATHKLSKRDGDASYHDFIDKGFLPQAIINYIALLGWSPKSEQEIFTLRELVDEFEISGISKSSAILDVEKMKYINSEHIKKLSSDEFESFSLPYLHSSIENCDVNFKLLSSLLHTRIEVFNDIPELVSFINELPDYSTDLFVNKKNKTDKVNSIETLTELHEVLSNVQSFSSEAVHSAVFTLIKDKNAKTGYIMWPLRVALSGLPSTPGGGIELAVVLGKEESLKRISAALEKLNR